MAAIMLVLNFLIASALVIASWLAYLYFNNLLDKHLNESIVMDILGIALTLALLAAFGLIINTYSFDFSTGVLVVSVALGIYFPIKKFISARFAQN